MEPNKQKNAIAEAAIRCFREHGYDEVSVQMICDEAGVVRSTFYRMFSGKKEIITYLMENTDTNQIVKLEDLLMAANDWERMWLIGDRYLHLAMDLGPGVMSALFIMELQGEIQILEMVKSIHDWFIRLTANCQQTGIIRNPEPAELLGPAMTHMVAHQIYVWASRGGDYPLRANSRRLTEMMVDLSPEYRWTEQQLKTADRVTGK